MIPWLYAPMLAQPMSSPMIMMMFGCLAGACASAGATTTIALNKPANAVKNCRNRIMQSPSVAFR